MALFLTALHEIICCFPTHLRHINCICLLGQVSGHLPLLGFKSPTFDRALIWQTIDGGLWIASDRKLTQNQRVARVPADKTGQDDLFMRLEHETDSVRENEQSGLFFDQANWAVRDLDLCAVAKDGLVVERRIKVDSLFSDIYHALKQDAHSGGAAVIFKNGLAFAQILELLPQEGVSWRQWHILLQKVTLAFRLDLLRIEIQIGFTGWLAWVWGRSSATLMATIHRWDSTASRRRSRRRRHPCRTVSSRVMLSFRLSLFALLGLWRWRVGGSTWCLKLDIVVDWIIVFLDHDIFLFAVRSFLAGRRKRWSTIKIEIRVE